MVTLITTCAMKGSVIDKIKIIVTSILLDCIYILPMVF